MDSGEKIIKKISGWEELNKDNLSIKQEDKRVFYTTTNISYFIKTVQTSITKAEAKKCFK